jgi:hypothetical protein
MSPARRRFVSGLLAVLVGGSLAHALLGEEHWPFCAYKMFSGVREGRSLTCLRVFGVVDGPQPAETPLLASAYLAPFDQSRLWRALMRVRKKPDGEARLARALRTVLARYEARRLTGAHHGPPLKALRLYELSWELDPWARNADQPDRRTLIAEVGPS